MKRNLLGTSAKGQAEVKMSVNDRLILLEDGYDDFQDAKEVTEAAFEDEIDADGFKVQQSGRVYKRLLKKGKIKAKYQYTNQ